MLMCEQLEVVASYGHIRVKNAWKLLSIKRILIYLCSEKSVLRRVNWDSNCTISKHVSNAETLLENSSPTDCEADEHNTVIKFSTFQS